MKNVAFQGAPTVLTTIEGAEVYQSTYASGLRLRRHGHDHAHLCFVLSGGYGENVEGGEHERGPGTLIWYPAGAIHAEHHLATGRHLLVEVEPHWDELHRFRKMPRNVTAWCAPTNSESARVQSLHSLSRRLHDAATAPVEFRKLRVEAALLELYAAMMRLTGPTRTRRTVRPARSEEATSAPFSAGIGMTQTEAQPLIVPDNAWPDFVRKILHARFKEKLYLAELARDVGVHPTHLTRGFREQFGCGIGDYVRRLRVLHAVERITQSDESLSSIAGEAGFADQCHLTRAVREHLNQTPAALRRSRKHSRKLSRGQQSNCRIRDIDP